MDENELIKEQNENENKKQHKQKLIITGIVIIILVFISLLSTDGGLDINKTSKINGIWYNEKEDYFMEITDKKIKIGYPNSEYVTISDIKKITASDKDILFDVKNDFLDGTPKKDGIINIYMKDNSNIVVIIGDSQYPLKKMGRNLDEFYKQYNKYYRK